MNTAQEKKFAACHEKLRDVMQMDYSLACNIFKCFKEFVEDGLESEMEIDSAMDLPPNANFGASVKIDGEINFVLGVFAEKKIFHDIAERYEHFETESLDEDFDAISELLNVVTGHLIVKFANTFGIEEDLEPPRFGQTEKNFGVIKISVSLGTFYLYLGKKEIFD
jgi:chemotaxis protein CheY-P-specific phosphatase CheC